jgi:hypothetical protein
MGTRETKMTIIALGCILLLGLLAGCGSTAYRAQGSSYGRTAAAESAAPAQPAPAPEMYAQDRSAPASAREAPRPEERPGLGTTYGETRVSHVRHRYFERSSPHPFSKLSLFYNDAAGIAAQLAYRGGEDLTPVHAATPHGGITVALQDQGGRVLPGRMADGCTYVAGRAGDRYAIVVRNHTGGRYEVVVTVDGLDVIDGRPGSISRRGYLIQPHGSLVIDGFRRSDSTVAAFRFGRVSDSYAARTSGDRNVGVIGFAFFSERGSVWTTDEIRRRETADPFPVDPRYAQPPI